MLVEKLTYAMNDDSILATTVLGSGNISHLVVYHPFFFFFFFLLLFTLLAITLILTGIHSDGERGVIVPLPPFFPTFPRKG